MTPTPLAAALDQPYCRQMADRIFDALDVQDDLIAQLEARLLPEFAPAACPGGNVIGQGQTALLSEYLEAVAAVAVRVNTRLSNLLVRV
jgi:hypothetical protein